MPTFGKRSLDNLKNVHPDLVKLAETVVQTYDCTVTDGERTLEEQIKNVEKGVSKTMESKHLIQPSGFAEAIDITPYPIDYSDLNRLYHFGGFVQAVAQQLGIKVRWGGDWNQNRNLKDQSFFDLVHFELI